MSSAGGGATNVVDPRHSTIVRTITRDVADGTTIPIYEAVPSEAARNQAVVVIQEAFGVNDHIEDVARRFAAHGYHAVAPHLFHRTGDPRLPYVPFEGVMPHMRALGAAAIELDVDAALDYLRDAGFGERSIAIVGFCMGGTVTVQTAARLALGAAVTFYGSGIVEGRWGARPLVEVAPALRAPWLGLYGDQDRGIPSEQVELLRRAAAHAPVETQIVRYPDAGHGFHCDARAEYTEAAARDAWRRTLEWLDVHLAP